MTEAETPRPSPTMDGGRSRKKKSFGDDFVNEDNQGKKQNYISKYSFGVLFSFRNS